MGFNKCFVHLRVLSYPGFLMLLLFGRSVNEHFQASSLNRNVLQFFYLQEIEDISEHGRFQLFDHRYKPEGSHETHNICTKRNFLLNLIAMEIFVDELPRIYQRQK